MMNPGHLESFDGVFYTALRCAFNLRRNYSIPRFGGNARIVGGSIEHDAMCGYLFVGSKRCFVVDGFDFLVYDMLVPQFF